MIACISLSHPIHPLSCPKSVRGEEAKANETILGMQKIAELIAELKPKTIAIITPHGHTFTDSLCINTEKALSGDFGQFGFPKLKLDFNGSDKAEVFCEALEGAGIQAVALNQASAKQYRISTKIDPRCFCAPFVYPTEIRRF